MNTSTPKPKTATQRLQRGMGEASWISIIQFLAPTLILFLTFVVIPFFLTFYNSVHILRMSGGIRSYEFVGLQHYVDLFTTDRFIELSMRNSGIWALLGPLTEIPIAFLLAYIVNRKVPFARFYRLVWFLPMLMSWVAIGALFRWVFNNDWGIINVILRPLGLDHNWLGDPSTALYSLISVTTWRWIGFNFIILLAAISSIPRDILDAAQLDGVNHWQRISKVVVPMIRGTVVTLILLGFVGKMRIFDLVWVMTRGAPLGYTETVATYIQKRAFEWNTLDLGYPSAIAVSWFLIVLVAWFILSRLLNQGDDLEY